MVFGVSTVLPADDLEAAVALGGSGGRVTVGGDLTGNVRAHRRWAGGRTERAWQLVATSAGRDRRGRQAERSPRLERDAGGQPPDGGWPFGGRRRGCGVLRAQSGRGVGAGRDSQQIGRASCRERV